MLNILLVDDDELVRQSLSMLLLHEGFEVSAAAGGQQALELARQQGFDLVISDVRMPDMDGFATVSNLRELLPDATFVLITGYTEQDAPVQALRMQVDDFFRKPFDLSLFLERIRQIRRQHKQRRTKTEEHSLENFISLLRKLPPYADRTDEAEQIADQAGRRLGLGALDLRALKAAVRFFDLVEPLPEGICGEDEVAHSLTERVAQVLGLAKQRPLPRDPVVQLVAALGAQQMGRPLHGLGLDSAIQEEVKGLQSQPSFELAPSPQEPRLKVLSLGETRVLVEGREILSAQWESSRSRWLFLFLLSRRGQWISSERLRDQFWPDSDAEKAQRSLVSSVHRCRKALADPECIVRTDRGYALNPEREVWWDVDQLLRLCRQARPLLTSAEECIPLLRQVENLYRGPFAPECNDDWAQLVRDEVQRCTLEALRGLGRLLLESDSQAAEGRARKILQLESTDEMGAEILFRALWAQDRRDEAIRFYREFKARLERELNLPPGPELLRTYLQLTQL